MYAFVGARLVISPDKVVEAGTLVVRDGVITAAGKDVAPPADARVWDLSGKTVYPGFIDAFSEAAAGDAAGPGYWNQFVTPQSRIAENFTVDEALNKKLRGQGFTARLAAPSGGIVKGRSALVTTGDDDLSRVVLHDDVALHARLTPARRSREDYPNSPMGAMALVRQAFYDAKWHAKAWAAFHANDGLPRPERNDALTALTPFLPKPNKANRPQPVIVDAPDELYFLRADRLGREFGLNVIVRGSGNEYRRLPAVKASGRAVIVPLNFPKAPNVSTPEAAAAASLEELMHWDHAPENPGRLAKAGVTIALTTHGLKEKDDFLKRLRVAVKRGLDRRAALAALTTSPARLFGADRRWGTLEPGKAASFVVADGDLLADKTEVIETWVDGRRYVVKESPDHDVRGQWTITAAGEGGQTDVLVVSLAGSLEKLTGTLSQDGRKVDLEKVKLDGAQLTARFKGDVLKKEGVVQWSAAVSIHQADPPSAGSWLGTIAWPDGTTTPMTARRTKPYAKSEDSLSEPIDAPPREKPARALFAVNFPLGAFGRHALPQRPKSVLMKNATVWTCGPQGILKDADVLIEAGTITQVGRGLKPPLGAVVIDCQGKHVTPGIIDCHSHIATDGGINESAQTITAEVRIGDYIDPDDVNIYRQLAGGGTAANILHGSANTIGGQNQVIKMRWGGLPENVKFAEAPQGIKFALGENVKQSNWGDKYVKRYPQTRMGVEQLVRDAFRSARRYAQNWERWRKDPRGLPPRVDLELAALAEVLSGKRLVHCHSYRQDEILALIRVCDDFKVRIAAFQHILEGYKLAETLKKHGAGGSAFSDWWAYKFEVYDAIPYNGALMHKAGVVVSFNSDDAELARRLNLEAAKAVKYGGVPAAEALKFVTLNAAVQLGIDKWTGSLEPGKQADVAVWSGSPLSTMSYCEQTWIDGRKYFDRREDYRRRKHTRQQRAALVQRILTTGAEMAALGDTSKSMDTLWPRHDQFCHHGHGHGHDHE